MKYAVANQQTKDPNVLPPMQHFPNVIVPFPIGPLVHYDRPSHQSPLKRCIVWCLESDSEIIQIVLLLPLVALARKS